MNNSFLKDINKIKLIAANTEQYFCYNINIYDGEKLIVTFETNGIYLYDRINKLMYESYEGNGYQPKKDIRRKYWDILPENACM